MTAQGRHAFRPVHLEGRPIGGQLGLGHGQALGLRRQAVGLSVQFGDLGLGPLQLHLQAHDHLLGGQRRPFPLNAPEPFDQKSPETPTPLPQGLQPHQPVAQVVASPGGQLGLGRRDLGVHSGQHPTLGRLVGGQRGAPPSLVPGPGLEGVQLPSRPVEAQSGQLTQQVAVPAGSIGLTFQRAELSADLAQQVGQPVQVGFGGPQPPLGLLLTAPVFQDPGRVLDDHPPVLRTGVQYGVDLALGDDDVLLATDPDVGQQFLDVQQAAGRAVHRVLAITASEQGPGDGHLRELHRELAQRVVDGQRHLSPAQGSPGGRASKDDIVHLLGSHSARRLGAQHPRDGVHHVGLSTAIGPYDHRDTGLHLQGRRVSERLEALDGQLFQAHAGPRAPPAQITGVSFAIHAPLGAPKAPEGRSVRPGSRRSKSSSP